MPYVERAWTKDELETLRTLWVLTDEETGKPALSTAKIGERMGRGKSSIVGKVHRLNLPGRPSPIKRPDAYPQAKKPGGNNSTLTALNRINPMPDRRLRGNHTLPPMVSEVVAEILVDHPPPPPAPIIIVPPPPPPEPVIIFRPPVSNNPCVFPTGESPRIKFECEATAEPGKPYCMAHAERCFVKIDRRTPPSGDPRPWLANPK